MKKYVLMCLFFFFCAVSGAQKPPRLNRAAVEPVPLKNLPPLLESLSAAEGKWILADTIPLKFRTFHTQGLMKVGDYFFMTAVEVLRKTKPYGSSSVDRRQLGFRTPLRMAIGRGRESACRRRAKMEEPPL